MVSVCFRLDDPSARSDHKLEARIFECFSRHDVPLCAAVVPFAGAGIGRSIPLSPQNAAHLFDAAKAGVIDISQHGHSHVHRGNDARGRRSEFAGLPLAEQARLIEEGRDLLASAFSRPIRGFVPPWNTYDESTTRALEESGFEYLSAGYDVSRFGRLQLVPTTCTLRDVKTLVEQAQPFASLAPVLVVAFHGDDFEEYHRSPRAGEDGPFTNIQGLDALFAWIKAQPRVRTDSLDRITRGEILQSHRELPLPHQVKSLLPRMLVRSGRAWSYVPGILWAALRNRWASVPVLAAAFLAEWASFAPGCFSCP